MAISASTPRAEGKQPLMAVSSARKQIMKLKNPDLEEQKVLAEEGKEIPPIKFRRMAAAVEAQGDPEGARLIMEWLEGEEMKNRQALASEQGGGAPPPAAAEQRPAAAPPSEDEKAVVEAVMNALVQYGREDLAKELAGALDGTTPPRDGLIQEIMQILGESNPELAQAFTVALGGGQPAGA
jgi:ribosomal protein L12E/L44/L45/RPP1/RPP2